LNTLRRAVFKEILRIAEQHEHVLVNTTPPSAGGTGCLPLSISIRSRHSTPTFTSVCSIMPRACTSAELRDHDIDHTLKDIMVWREEELLATEILANITAVTAISS
jgi:adenylate kinase